MALISYFSEGISFQIPHPRKTATWIGQVIKKEKSSLVSLNYVFCSDKFLLAMNKSYLQHTTLTDIITFNLSESPKQINGEIYISVDRVKDNARSFGVSFEEELLRVIIHGVLHLIGYNDKKKLDKAVMRKKESAYLSLYQ